MNIIGIGDKSSYGNTSGIYLIVNNASENIYVGSAIKVRTRINGHVAALRDNRHRNIYLQRSWNAHGSNVFSFFAIEQCHREQLISKEQEYIDKYRDIYGWSRLYNIDPKAYSKLGSKHTEETKKRISAIKMNVSPEIREKLSNAVRNANNLRTTEQKEKFRLVNVGRTPWNKGVPMREETRLKLSSALRGRRATEETRMKLSLARKGKPTGRVVSQETRRKMSMAKLGKKQSLETCLKKSEAKRNAWKNGVYSNRKTSPTRKPNSKDAINRMIAALTGRKQSPETCKKRSESVKAAWASGKFLNRKKSASVNE